ncbi:MAG TPA: winged helix-turn-helix domain-containing protein [Shinella sp.]|uniref:ATP-binding protein n=1 Tax=Shinella sp. TaxID=1870904 RepID=UPI002E0EBE06|nr:winged helix-turn-helix domain-containing protein [Shinella sp.]
MTTDLPRPPGRTYVFGPFRLIPQRQLLVHGEQRVRIGGRALDILTVLVENPGEIVSQDELRSRVWPKTFVEDGNLKVNMAGLRRALGDRPAGPRYISTVIGRGYRFVAPVGISDSAEPIVEAVPAPGRSHNLPTATVRIVGRDHAIASINRELENTRLVSVVGAGGVGKTTVALAVAEQAIGRMRDGVWFIDLAALTDPSLIASAIATISGLTAHSANMQAAVIEFLRDRQMLLLLDSCEHVIEPAAAIVDRILAEAAGVRILATSREPLRVKGERVRRLPGLGIPGETTVLTAAKAMGFPAVELFVERATDRLETFTLSDAEAPLVAEICRKLDGLALAIELAATRIDAFGVTGLLARLDDRLRLLEGHRGGIERHRTLSATIDWSYGVLTPSERLVMRRLAVFAGAFGLASAIAVASDERVDRVEVAQCLANLVSKSLLSAEIRGSEMEYRQLDSTRAYALQKLAEEGEIEQARQRHAVHCLELLGQANSDAEKLSNADWLSRHGGKVDDIRSALHWAHNSATEDSLAVKLTVASIPFGKQVSLVEECRQAVELVLEERFRPHRNSRDDLLLNLTLGATLLHTRGPLVRVKISLTKALAIAEEIGDVDLQLECLRGLSEFELWTGDSHSAIAVAEKMRALTSKGQAAAAGDADAQTGSALSWLGVLAAARHRLESIVQRPVGRHLRPDVARFEFDQRLTARGALATVLWLQGFPDQAVEIARRQLREAEASNYAVSLCYALLHGSAIISMYIRDYEEAYRYLDLGAQHATRHGLTIWRAMAIGPRNRLNLYTCRPIDLSAFRDTLAEVRDGGFRMRYPNYLTNYGEALARQGDLEGGLAAIDEAIALCRSSGQVVGIPEILRIKGNTIRFGDPAGWERAVDCYLQSIELAREDRALSWELRSAISLVKLWRTRGGSSGAEDMLRSVHEKFTEGFTTGDLRRARALLDARPAV